MQNDKLENVLANTLRDNMFDASETNKLGSFNISGWNEERDPVGKAGPQKFLLDILLLERDLFLIPIGHG